ncbi:MAG: acyl carrier protein [Victivallales bacterium]|nr:acyl carrier protein [Victivallales bacterium]
MSDNSIKQCLGDYISALTGSSVEPTTDSTLESLGVDSISLVKIFVFIEKKFGVAMVNSGVSREDIETLGKLADFIGSLSERE